MYIGKLGDGSSQDDGVYVLLKEVMDNALDEYMMGYGKKKKCSWVEHFYVSFINIFHPVVTFFS